MVKILNYLLPPRKWVPFVIVAVGIGMGLFAYLLYVSNAVSYLSDDPKTCVNCHVMTPFYATWQHSSHARVTTCNDCHVPHNNALNKYFFKAKDGIYHATVFTWRAEPQVIHIKEAGTDVVQKNCQRCHGDLNSNVSTLGVTLESKQHGEGKLCWTVIEKYRMERLTVYHLCLMPRFRCWNRLFRNGFKNRLIVLVMQKTKKQIKTKTKKLNTE